MEDSEEYFPRGGKKPVVPLFKSSDNFLGGIEKGEKKKRKPKKKSDDDGYLSDDEDTKDLEQSQKNCAAGINYETIKPGTLVLGRVRQVLETKVNVMLPSKMMGSVMACHISEPYNKLLEAYVNDQTEKVPELSQMFRPGQYVALKVVEATRGNLMLSMMPQHINDGKSHTDLQKGTILQAAVSSVEDHGYVMDVGIPNTRAFLPTKNANPEVKLDNGAITWCVMKSVSTTADVSTVTLSNDLSAIQSAVQRRQSGILLPGTGVQFTVDQALDNGVEGRIFKDTVSYVQRYHADNSKGKRPKLGQKVQARVLYVMPIRNTPFLTTRNIFETIYPNLEDEQKLKDGQIVEEAQVIKITGRSIHFKLGAGSIGTMSLKRIHVDEELTDEQVILKSYPIGSNHRVRVLCYHLSDYQYSVTDEPALLNEKYFSVEQLRAGDLVPATVKAVEGNRLLLTIGRVTGYVPRHHLTDAGMFVDPKKASTTNLTKKFKVGQDVKARILALDIPGATAFLTLKPSLLDPELEVLSSYHDAQIGKGYTGTIQVVRNYVLVCFFNNVMAYIPRNYVTRDSVENLSSVFHIGQIVKCTILKVDPENKKMSGSFVTTPFWPAKKREKINKTQQILKNTEDVPNKKRKSDETQTEISEKKKRKREEISAEDIRTSKSETKQTLKKSKNKKDTMTPNEFSVTDNDDVGITEASQKRNKNHKKEKNMIVDNEDSENDHKKNKRENKKVKKRQKSEESKELTEESDAIETDIYDDSDQLLTPQDLGLIDFSDCTTPKKYKKRVVSLLNAIKSRTRRFDKIDRKILKIEETGLNAKNKQFHTAMHREKIVVQERIQKLTEALEIAQTKLKEYGLDDSTDHKNKKNKKDTENNRSIEEEKTEKPKKNKLNKVKNIKVVENLTPALEVPSAKDFWSANTDNTIANTKDESSSSNEEEESQPKKKRKKLSVAEKVAKVRDEEERVREMERRAIESESQPRSVEQFERVLLASPDCSQLWIAYMAFHLQATEIDKARAVGRKALKTISFREEEEKLNVWLALLNCEHRFGTKESQQKTLEEALQMNEPFKIHSKLLDIYIETSKQQELTSLVDLMVRKYKRNPETYTRCGNACFKLGLVEKARQVMQKGVSVLEKKEHIAMLVQFALMERSAGERERAEALFEQILAAYPQRVDVCNTYVDMLVKGGDIERVRQVMERITAHKLPARKMKVLYNKWVEVEEKLNDAEHAQHVRQLAVDYIDKAKF